MIYFASYFIQENLSRTPGSVAQGFIRQFKSITSESSSIPLVMVQREILALQVVRVYAQSGNGLWFDPTSHSNTPVITDFNLHLLAVTPHLPMRRYR